MQLIPQFEFDVYALSLPAGHRFRFQPPVGAWRTDDGLSCGVLTQDVRNGTFGVFVLRRRVDDVWAIIHRKHGFAFKADALSAMTTAMAEGEAPAALPAGVPRRPALYDLQDRRPSDIFKLLTAASHQPAGWLLNQLYLAMPDPDPNWAGDCQTSNFHTRLWEAQLLASLREQGLLVTQPFGSPDFRVENARGESGWIEVVTANPSEPYNHVNAPRPDFPTERDEIFFGSAAVRFAKTLGNKLDRRYDLLPHVAGAPFALALADFQAGGSMVWSREALIGYLYGEGAMLGQIDGQPAAIPFRATHLRGPSRFPTGLFANDLHAELSAVIFTNACTLGKFNRVMVSGGVATELRYTRVGNFFNRGPGALRGTPFCMDVASAEYRDLWGCGFEPWCVELEVFHNPFARNPWPESLTPEATHWVEEGGERVCHSHYERSILWSVTFIQDKNQPPIKLEDILNRGGADNQCEEVKGDDGMLAPQ
jgi:hypothetical protein